MRRVNADVAAKKTALAHHQPATHESKSAQDAAVAPPDDKEAQGKVANSAKMDAAKPGGFDKAAFIRAVNDAIAAQAPKNLDDADKFSKSGKAEKIKGAVDGKVTAGKDASAHAITTTTNAPPDTSAAKPKQVTPMQADHPPSNPGAPNAADAAPQPQPAAVTDFSGGPKQTDQQMAAADVTDHQLASSNEPEFTGALKDKKTADAHSATAPAKARAGEKQQITEAKSGAAASGAQAMAHLTATRAAAGKAVDGGKGHAKSQDEQRRAQATGRLQKVFDATKKDVESILSGLDKKVDQQFAAGESKARAAFEADQKRRMDAYKSKRYSGLTGKGRWIEDKFAGLPKEADDLFQISRQLYVSQMQGVISSIADTIGTELGRAKARIAQGRKDLTAEVNKLPADLRKYGQEAAKDFASKFDDLESEVNDKSKQLVQDLATKYTQALHKIDDEIKKLQDANKGLVAKAVGAIAGVIKTIIELKNMLMGVLAKAATAIGKIIKDPIGFLNNLVHAVGAGLKLFLANIADHLKKGLVSWLLGTAIQAGLSLPSSFDLKGIIQLIASLLGLTWANIRARITRKGIPDRAVTAVEKSVPIAEKLAREGPAGAEKEIVAEVGDLKASILGKLTSYLIPTVIIAGITWILSLLNPASAFVRAVKAIIDIVTFVVTQGAQVLEFVNSVLDAVIAIANGGTGGVPPLVEAALAASIPTLLGLLASLLGIENLASKVKSVFHAVARPVNKVIDKIVGFIVKIGKKLWAKLKGRFKKGGRHQDKETGGENNQTPDSRTDAQKQKDLTAGLNAAESLIKDNIPEHDARRHLPEIKRRYYMTSLTLTVKTDSEGEQLYSIDGEVNPRGNRSGKINGPKRGDHIFALGLAGTLSEMHGIVTTGVQGLDMTRATKAGRLVTSLEASRTKAAEIPELIVRKNGPKDENGDAHSQAYGTRSRTAVLAMTSLARSLAQYYEEYRQGESAARARGLETSALYAKFAMESWLEHVVDKESVPLLSPSQMVQFLEGEDRLEEVRQILVLACEKSLPGVPRGWRRDGAGLQNSRDG
ncbi:hypothetical protein [Streptomyces sp900116325]|uniref:phage tail protein n=1 Tax=Streptomyces sp. 900116325 TaxID=3154295 RepID=UPI0033EA1986